MKKAMMSIVFLFVLNQEALGLDFKEDRIAYDKIAQVSSETLNSEYEKAIQHTQEIIDLYPREPIPRFLMTSIYMYMLRSYWDFPADERYAVYQKKFEEAAQKARKTCDTYPSQDAMVHFVRGMVLGSEALVHLQNKEWLESYSKGKEGVAALEKSLEMDPDNHDVYLGLGMFEYYCSKLSGVVKLLAWIVGFRGNSEKGIEYVTRAMNKGKFAEGPAKVFLAYAFIEYENKLDEGIALTRSLRAQYPRNYLYVEYVVRAASKLPAERADEGLAWINRIIKTPDWRKEIILFIPYNMDIVDYVEACLHMSMGDYDVARSLLEPVALRTQGESEFRTNVNLALLLAYKKTERMDRARELFSLILRSRPINDSHLKAREILRG